MIKLEADPSKNLLTIRYAGAVGPAEVEIGLNDVRAGLVQLRQNFRLLADLSELESMDVACAPFIEKAMDMCNEKGASIVVRVIPDPRRDIGLQIMSIFHYAPDVRIVNCETLDQAKRLLDN